MFSGTGSRQASSKLAQVLDVLRSKDVVKFIKNADFKKVVEKGSTAAEGTRLEPARSMESKGAAARIDRSHNHPDDKFEIVLQPNKDSSVHSFRKAAEKDSHAVIASAIVDPKSASAEEDARRDMFASYEAKVEGNKSTATSTKEAGSSPSKKSK